MPFRFFLNDFSTTTQGIDLISTLALGRTTFSAVFNYTDTAVKNIESSVIDEFRINTLERGLPKTRWNLTVNHDAGRWRLMDLACPTSERSGTARMDAMRLT